MVKRIILAGLLLAAGGCAWLCPEPPTRTVVETVEVPAPYREPWPEPPEALAAPYRPGVLPEFISPSSPEASVALDPEGAEALRVMLRELTGRLKAWREWQAEPP